MNLQISKSNICGNIKIPGSKSHTIRGIVMAFLAEGESILYDPLISQDTLSVLHAIEDLGAGIKIVDNNFYITGTGGKIIPKKEIIDLGNSGTGLRILTAVCSLSSQKIVLDGDESLRTRIMKSELDSLKLVGANYKSSNGFAPIEIHGPLSGGKIKVDGTTSQFLTALLISLPLVKNDSEIELDFLNEKDYVEMTLDWLDFCGIKIEKIDDLHYKIPGNQKYKSFKRIIPADFSTASFPLVAGLLSNNFISVENLDFSDKQGDKLIFEYVKSIGAKIEVKENKTYIYGSKLNEFIFDLNRTPDALPIISVLALFINGTSKIVNVKQARLKETDRIKAMFNNLSLLGANIEETEDGLIIHGGKPLKGNILESYNDHRIIMSLAIAGLFIDEDIIIKNAENYSVTWPDFIKSFKSIGANFKEIE